MTKFILFSHFALLLQLENLLNLLHITEFARSSHLDLPYTSPNLIDSHILPYFFNLTICFTVHNRICTIFTFGLTIYITKFNRFSHFALRYQLDNLLNLLYITEFARSSHLDLLYPSPNLIDSHILPYFFNLTICFTVHNRICTIFTFGLTIYITKFNRFLNFALLYQLDNLLYCTSPNLLNYHI